MKILRRTLMMTAVCALVATGCAGKLPGLSAPQVGCPADDIEIENDTKHGEQLNWEAKCNRRWYRCSQVGGGAVSCQHFRRRGGQMAELSAGLVGCSPNDIEIDEDSGFGFGARTWQVHCLGRVFQCSGAARMGMSCAPVPPPQAPAPGAAPPPSGTAPPQ